MIIGGPRCLLLFSFSLPKVKLFNKEKIFSLQRLLCRKKSLATSYIKEAFFLAIASGVEILRLWKFPINDAKQCNILDVDSTSDRQTKSPKVYNNKHLKLFTEKRQMAHAADFYPCNGNCVDVTPSDACSLHLNRAMVFFTAS